MGEKGERTELLTLKREGQIAQVVELLATGKASSIRDACQQTGVSRKSLYKWISEGVLDTALTEVKANATTEAVSLLMGSLPEVVQKLIEDALDEGGKLSARDRDSARRTYLLAVQKLGHLVPDVPTGEDAREWLKKHDDRKSFSPVQINIHVKDKEPTTIEVEAEELGP